MPERTPLYEQEEQAGAVFCEEAGWLVPAHFGDPAGEYAAARDAAAVFDVSHRGKVEVTGADARSLLHNLCTNDIKNLPPGQHCEAFLTNHRARVIAHVFIHHRGQGEGRELFLLDVAPGLAGQIVQHLEHFHISEDVEIADRTGALAHLQVTGASGTDLIVPREQAVEQWQRLIAAGVRPAGRHVHEILRIEAGMPAPGQEIDADRFAPELGRAAAISYTKGCYLGQEPIVMARDRGHVNRLLLGLKLSAGPAPRGARLFRDGKEVGQVTSSVRSPRLGPIALAFVQRGHQEPGTRLEVQSAEGTQTAEVTPLPFSSPQRRTTAR
jgi:folate-binding protein YgfZ